MNKRTFRTLALLVMLSLAHFTDTGCGILHPGNQRKVEKKQAQAEKQADKEYEKARQQHLKNQHKETIHMMKKTKKRSAVINKPKKRGFLSSKKCR